MRHLPQSETRPLTFANARIVLDDDVLHGSVQIDGGRVVAIDDTGSAGPGAIDLEGDYLLPGCVDLHTDNLERQAEPRSGTRWPARSALLAHDAQCAASGITTVLDALCVGDLGFDEDRSRTCREGVENLDALLPSGLLKAEHFLHLRCELPARDMMDLFAPLATHPLLRLVSLMDHTPGGGQYADIPRYRAMRLRDGDDPAAIEASICALQAQRAHIRGPNRAALLSLMRQAAPHVALASHDDRTAEDVAENLADGIPLAEFPVTLDAAGAAQAGGQMVIVGAPNLVRGGSHTGNVSASSLVSAGFADAFASDYVPGSLIEAAFIAAGTLDVSLPRAVGMISAMPASMIGLADRGRIAVGLRADLVRVRVHAGAPVVRQVYLAGERVI